MLEPWLATEFSWSEDNLTLTMPLRTDVKWSDGTPFTAADVAYTFDLLQQFPALIGSASGAWDDYLAGVKAVDDATVAFTFSRVFTPAIYLLGNQTIVAKHIWETIEDPVTTTFDTPVGTGPFTDIAIFQPQGYEAHKNPNYWGADCDPRPALQGVHEQRPNSRLNHQRRGRLGWTRRESGRDVRGQGIPSTTIIGGRRSPTSLCTSIPPVHPLTIPPSARRLVPPSTAR